MRFAQLNLLRYGSFDNVALIFPKSERDFHLILGPNEAGKTTALDAITDLLFGFPHAKTQDYRFDANLLRVGAEVENGHGPIPVFRKRGLKGTLLDPSDQIVPENSLQLMLHGLTRETYRLAWSLNHQQLREGGQAIADAKDDIGQALFAAGSGLVSIPRILQELEKEVDTIWRPRGRTGTWNTAQRSYQEAMNVVREKSLRPTKWIDAKEKVEKLEQEKSQLEAKRRDLQIEEQSLQRIRRVLPLLYRLSEIESALDGCTQPPLTDAQEASFFIQKEVLAKATAEVAKDERLLQSYENQLELLVQDPDILSREQAIQELIEDRGAVRSSKNDLPKRQAELDLQLATIAGLKKELAIQEEKTIEELISSLPLRTQISRLREHLTELSHSKTLAKQAGGQKQALERREAELISDPVEPVKGLPALEDAVKQARKEGRLDIELRELQKRADSLARTLEGKWAQLQPWEGDIERLQQVVVPPDAIIEKYRKRLDDAEREVGKERENGSSLEQRIQKQTLKRNQLAKSGRAVPLVEITNARGLRDQVWTTIRDHLGGHSMLTDVKPVIDSFETLTSGADHLADERFNQAEASAQLSDLDDAIEQLRLEQNQHFTRLKQLEEANAEATQAWKSETASRRLPEVSPPDVREWLKARSAVITAYSELAAVKLEVAETVSTRQESIRVLISNLPKDTEPPEVPELIAEALAYVEGVLEKLLAQKRQYDRYSAELASVREELAKAVSNAEEAKNKVASRAELLRTSLADTRLTNAPDLHLLDIYDELRNEADKAQTLYHRVETMSKNCNKFENSVRSIAQAFGLTGESAMNSLETLKKRLDSAKAEKEKGEHIDRAIQNVKRDLLQAQADREAAEESITHLADAAASKDIEAIERFVSRSRDIRTQLVSLHRQQDEVIKAGDGRPLELLRSETAAAAPDVIDRRSAELTEAINELDSAISGVAQRLGEAREGFAQIDTGMAAVEAAADAELFRGQMDNEADEYLLKRSQLVLLRLALQRQRNSGQSPVLSRAGELFERFTLGKYSGLTADTDSEMPKLVGVSSDGTRTVPIQVMSDGAIDQLYMALRIAAIEQSLASGTILPFIADDLFIHYDNARARAGFEALSELSRTTQVLFFTHNAHLLPIAAEVFGEGSLHTCMLES